MSVKGSELAAENPKLKCANPPKEIAPGFLKNCDCTAESKMAKSCDIGSCDAQELSVLKGSLTGKILPLLHHHKLKLFSLRYAIG